MLSFFIPSKSQYVAILKDRKTWDFLRFNYCNHGYSNVGCKRKTDHSVTLIAPK